MPSETRRCLHKSEYSGNLFQVGRLAQLARAPRLHRGCQGFESLIAHRVMCQDIVPVFWHILFCFLRWYVSRHRSVFVCDGGCW